ncbi:N-acetylglucosamine-6-phosphate deacetylase [Paenibacillus sp. HJGM_3]|uniref:N-acetylglucosamine-6-phosphate deacetylase n=1 Tax=Paenibacillus sp. HJGM_3 TaxID=3379816 RepID=UPI00385C5238
MKPTRLINAAIVTEEGVLAGGTITFTEGRIVSIEPASNSAAPFEGETIDAAGGWVLPGFVDVHVHGGYGGDFMDASAESLDKITRFHGGNGTTSIVATTVTASREDISRVLASVHAYRQQPMPGAQVVGVHLEGPFVNPKWKGAQNPAYMLPPQKEWLVEWTKQYPGLIRQVTLAPEIEGALDLIEWLSVSGIVAAAGHTDATYDQIEAAIERGLSQAVHTYNAMTPLHHRNPGTVGAVLTDPRIHAEVIADGHHVHPAAIRLVTLVKNDHNLLLITDAMAAAGLGDGLYDLGGLAVNVKAGVATLAEGNSLAGSTLTMIEALRFVVEKVGLTVPEASVMASGNPARQLGLFEQTGSLAVGKQADVLLVSSGLKLERVWAKGNPVEVFAN